MNLSRKAERFSIKYVGTAIKKAMWQQTALTSEQENKEKKKIKAEVEVAVQTSGPEREGVMVTKMLIDTISITILIKIYMQMLYLIIQISVC